jgi:pyruvate dehydrogenase E2 component (dihydrolipoamide acetyltransferase)
MVRRLARDQGVDLGQVQGSGPEGRITQEDLAGFTAQQGLVQAAATAPPPASAVETKQPQSAETTSPQPSGSMRQAIAAAVTHSWQTIPHFSVTMEIDMDACREIVSELKATPHPVGYNALLIKACATALERFPLLRSGDANDDGGIHISIAVALPDGLLMPVIRRCDSLSLAEIERETTQLIDKSRLGRLTSKEMSDGCFSVSNLGMYGVEDFTALIMPGQTAILSVGAVNQRPVVRNGTLAVAATARVTLSSDHRVVDGAYAARFLADLRAILEQPLSMVI